MKVLYSAVYGEGYPFSTLVKGGTVVGVTHPDDMKEFDSALVVWGGSDISPDLYNHPTSKRCSPYAVRRDAVEWALMKEAIEMEIPIIGVCRGAQMLCAAAGGFLIQDVNNHAGPNHEVTTQDGKRFNVNSIHHQMMVPYGCEHEVVAWASKANGEPYIFRDDKIFKPAEYGYSKDNNPWKEPEFVYFPKIDGYAIQWHPEAMAVDSDATQYILDFFFEKQKVMRPKKFWVTGETETDTAMTDRAADCQREGDI